MVRRLQLMEPEPRGLGTRITQAAARLREGMLRDNKVLPPVLAALALIIFAWLLAGVIIGDPREGERVARQAAQPSVAQAPDNGGGSSETPAPSVEDRDSESIDVYESKDPFRELFPSAGSNKDAAGGDTTGNDAGSAGGGTDPSRSEDGTEGGTGSGGSDGNGSGFGNGPSGGSGSDSDQYGGDGGEDFLDQTSPGDPGFDDGNGSGNGGGPGDGGGSGGNGGGSRGSGGGNGGGSGGGNGSGSGSGTSGGQYGDGDGNGNLFDSGGGLDR